MQLGESPASIGEWLGLEVGLALEVGKGRDACALLESAEDVVSESGWDVVWESGVELVRVQDLLEQARQDHLQTQLPQGAVTWNPLG